MIVEVCDSIEWNGNVYTTSGRIYVDTLQTISGCDSIITMDLTINNTVFSNDSAEVCDSDVEWECILCYWYIYRYTTDN